MLKCKHEIISLLKKRRLKKTKFRFVMNNKKRNEILLKVIDNVYDKYANTQEFINSSMVEICKEVNASNGLLCFAML